MHCAYKKNYNNNKALLANLWNEITTQMLHQDCVTGYEQLKQSATQYIVKTKSYSLLVGYFKQLATKYIISNDDFARYKKFLHAICNTDNQVEHNIEFCTIDLEITNLLTYLKRQDEDFVSLAYKQDHLNNQTNYNNSREFNNLLSSKFAETTREIADKYKKVLLNLTNERDQKNKDLENNYTTIKQQTETEWYNHEHTYNAYITSLNENKASIERQLVEKEQQEKDKINDNYQQELKSIDDSVKEITEQVNSNLKEQLKQLRRAARASVINVFTSISTAIAAYFSGGLLSGFSNYIVEGVRNSLIATSLGSLESLIKDKEKIGAKLVFNFPQGPTHDFTPEVARSSTVQKQEPPDFSANLAKLKEEFSIFNQRVHTWQTQAEHDLFYSLNRGMFFRPNFSNAVAVYSSQSYNFNFGIDAELGQLQPNGYRNVRWNISLDNNRWYGDNLMQDRDIRNIIQQITKNSESLLNNNWLRPQKLSFNSTFNENSSNWLKSFSHKYIHVSNKKHLEASLGEKLLILAGGAMVNAWSGVKQGAYMAGERLGILTPDTTLNYTSLRNQELQLYNSTPVGQSALRPWVEFGTGMLLYSAVPVAAYGRMGLLANGALSGGIIAGLQFTEDGQLSSRLVNSAIGAVVGAGVGVAVNKIGGSLLRLYDLRQAQNVNKYALTSNFGRISKTNKLKSSFKSVFDGRLYPKNKLAVSSPNLRVDTSKLPNPSSSIPSASSSSTSTKLSKETQQLLNRTNRYKKELFERPGNAKSQTTLNAAKTELQGKQIDLAIERGVSFDHIEKVENAQRGLLNHIGDINARLSHPELPMIEREALTTELSKASKLLDHTEQFVPRTTSTPQNPKPKAP